MGEAVEVVLAGLVCPADAVVLAASAVYANALVYAV
jgi:hypothetical protein